MKTGFPVICIQCRSVSGRPNGIRKTKYSGDLQQIRCSTCARQWTVRITRKDRIFNGRRVRIDEEKLLQAFALFALQIPMSKIEKLVGIKAETITAKLESLFGVRGGHGYDIRGLLVERFGLPESDVSDFVTLIQCGREFSPSAYRCYAKEYRRLAPSERAKTIRMVAKVMGSPVGEIREVLQGRARG
jgi:hypothetical protein